MRRIVAAIAAILTAAALVLIGAFAATSLSPNQPTSRDNPTAMRGCVIRFDQLSATGNSVVPRILADSAHMCVGVESVRANWSQGWQRGLLVIEHTDDFPVVSISISPDETFAERGITCGASGGGATTNIACYDRDGEFVPASSLDLYGPTSNLWVTWTVWDETS